VLVKAKQLGLTGARDIGIEHADAQPTMPQRHRKETRDRRFAHAALTAEHRNHVRNLVDDACRRRPAFSLCHKGRAFMLSHLNKVYVHGEVGVKCAHRLLYAVHQVVLNGNLLEGQGQSHSHCLVMNGDTSNESQAHQALLYLGMHHATQSFKNLSLGYHVFSTPHK